MADKKISQLDLVAQINNDAAFPMSQENGGEQTTYKAPITDIAAKIGEGTTFSNLATTAKNLVGAINEIEAGGGGGSSNANLAPDYDATSTYAVGDWCIYNGTLYQCNTAISTAEAFNPTHWTAKKVVDAFADIENELDDKVDTTNFLATNLPIQSGSATNTKDYIDSNCVTITTGVFTASTNVNVLRSTLIKIGKLKILSVIFTRTGDTNTLGTVSSGFEATYNYDFIATRDYGEGVRMRINQSNSISFSTTPNANDFYAFILAYV